MREISNQLISEAAQEILTRHELTTAQILTLILP